MRPKKFFFFFVWTEFVNLFVYGVRVHQNATAAIRKCTEHGCRRFCSSQWSTSAARWHHLTGNAHWFYHTKDIPWAHRSRRIVIFSIIKIIRWMISLLFTVLFIYFFCCFQIATKDRLGTENWNLQFFGANSTIIHSFAGAREMGKFCFKSWQIFGKF